MYHPDDPLCLRVAQEEALLRLHEAAAALEAPYLIELLPPRGGELAAGALPALMAHFYRLGLAPDWWKLPVQPAGQWAALGEVVRGADPACRGILVLGSDHPAALLERGVAEAARHPAVAGFAIGRAIWAAPARAFFAGEADAAETRRALGAAFARFVGVWNEIRGEAA